MLKCCGYFVPEHKYQQKDNDNYYNIVVEYGFCPHCENMNVSVYKFDKKTQRQISEYYKKRKAFRYIADNKKNFIKEIFAVDRGAKTGNKSNMGFRYGVNKEVKNSKGDTVAIKSYAVDFNGTIDKTTVKSKKV